MRQQPQPPLPSPLAPSPYSPSLAVTGLLMIGTLFVIANPGFGIKTRLWPWELFVQGHASLLGQAMFALWMVTAGWCLTLAFSKATAVRAVGAAALGLPLLITATGGAAGLTIADYNLNKVLPMILLGGGLLLALEPPTRSAGRLVAGAGALLLTWALATGFSGTGGSSQLVLFFDDLSQLASDPSHEFAGQPNHVWWVVVPQLLVFLGALGGLLALLGLTQRVALHIAFWTLFAGLLAPGLAGSVIVLNNQGGLNGVLEQVVKVLIGHGAMLWMLGVYVIADLGKLNSVDEPTYAEEVA